MVFLNDREKNRITEAIRDVETRTSGELVTVIAQESDPYHFIPMLWAAVVAMLIPVVFAFLNMETSLFQVSMAQLAVFCALALVGRWRPLKYRLIPKWVKTQRTTRYAHEQFFLRGVGDTADRNGILLFVSVGERYVEVLADRGIDELVDDSIWRNVVDDFVAKVKAGRIADGFLAAIEACGAVLIEHFPQEVSGPNELPDHLLEV